MLQLITIRMGNYYIGIDLRKVVRVLAAQSLIELSNKPVFVSGLMDFNGEIIVIIDLYNRLNITHGEEIELSDKFIITDTGKRLIGFRCDEVTEILTIDCDEPVRRDEICPGADFVSVVKSANKLLYIYDPEALLNSNELIDIETLIESYSNEKGI